MALLNVNSLLAHIDELKIFTSANALDVLIINETKLDSMVDNREVNIPGYEIIRNDRRINGREGGGVCIYIRCNLNYTLRDDLEVENLETLVIQVNKLRSKPILISTWYRPPDTPITIFDNFEELIGKMDSTGHEIFLLGDFNVDFMPGANANNTNKLKDIFATYGLEQQINEPTRVTSNASTLIDLCATNTATKIVNSGVLHLGISDHSLIYMTYKTKYERSGKRIIEIRSMKNFRKEQYLWDLEQQNWNDIKLSSDPNTMWSKWKSMLMECIDRHAPLRHKRVGNRRSPWITSQLQREMRKRDYLKQKAVREDNYQIWEQFKHARNHTNNLIKTAKREYFVNNFEINKSNSKETWNLINQLSSRSSKKSVNISEIKTGTNVINTPTELAETFNLHFSTVGKKLAAEIPNENMEPEDYMQRTQHRFSLKAPTVSTVYKLLENINVRKATGLDGVSNKLLKFAAHIVAPSLTEIFTTSINTGIFPTEWKIARVTPIFKKGKKNDLNNYRPISVIPTVAKILEKIVYEQLFSYFNDNLLTPCQSGFRSFHSTLTALTEATNNWSVNIDNGLLNGVVFLDLKKAFDTIEHSIILRKLQFYGIEQESLKWFQSYLDDRKQVCCVNGHMSNSLSVSCGVPQGSNLGPLLFLIYINDLPNCLSTASPRMFADDTNVSLASSTLFELENMLNQEFQNLNIWLKVNKLSLNIAKTEFMIIGSRQRLNVNVDGHINISINDQPIKKVNETETLGMTIDQHLTWSKQVEEKSKKISSAIGALKRIRPFITIDVANKIYKTIIQPHLDYCSTVWDGLGVTLLDKIQKLQNRAARIITQSSYYTSASSLLEELGWDNVLTRWKKQKAILMFKTLNNRAPEYLRNLFIDRNTHYDLRNAGGKLNLPRSRTDYLKRSFSYSGAQLWNNLPESIRTIKSLKNFKKAIQNYFEND